MGGEPAEAPAAFAPVLDALVPDDAPAPDEASELHRVTRLSYGFHLRVLLVADDPDAATTFTAAADESVLEVDVEVATSVDDAVHRLGGSFLHRRRRHVPDIVVSAVEVAESHRLLVELREDARFAAVPVIVLSADQSPGLERRSFALGAAGHLGVPRRDYERVALVHALPDFIPRARAAHAQIESQR